MAFASIKLTIFVAVSLSVSALCCESGWFGSRCEFKCHCKANTDCNDRGVCLDGCADGYFGHKCQYVDSDLPLHQKQYTDDGRCDFKQKESNKFLTYYFMWARFTFEDLIPAYVSIYFRDQAMRNFMDCKNYYISFVDSKTFDYFCEPFLNIRDMYIFSNFGTAAVCKMYMSRGRNLALKQQTENSSTVDGDRTSNANCFLTNVWSLSLTYPSSINNIVIYSVKGNDVPTFEVNYKIGSDWEAYDESLFTEVDGVYVSEFLGFRPPISDLNIRVLEDVKIHFCEVEVIGDFICPKSRYGSECEYTCTCQKDSKDCAISEQCGPACDPKVSSTCKHESVRRYMKLPYIQIPSIVECPAGTYGINCDENCSSICQNCDGLTGRCPTCPAGMHGDFCEEDCEMFTYGPGCELQCSTNCLYNMCNEVDGECIRCPAGQYGSYCDHVCDKHYYGNNCNFKCSQECEDQICRGTDGVCLSCPPGRQGSFCDTECDKNYYGRNCNFKCSENCTDYLCNITDGFCLNCPSERVGNFCENAADPNQGNLKCSKDCGSFNCDPSTGKCMCPPGRFGDLCEHECSNTTFGFNCLRHCNKDCLYDTVNSKRLCDPVTGECIANTSNLLPHSTGEESEDDSLSRKYLLIVLPVLVIAMFVIFVFLLRKTKQVQSRPSMTLSMQGQFPMKRGSVPYKNNALYALQKSDLATTVPTPQLKFYLLGHNRDFFLAQFKSITAEYDPEKPRKKGITPAYKHFCITITPWPTRSPGKYLTHSFLALSKEKIIAAQGPLAGTVVSFFNMLWIKKVVKIAVISNYTNDKEDYYWSKKDRKIGTFRVKTLKTVVFTDYTERTMEITKDKGDNPPRQLTHFQYTALPEDGSDPCLWSLVDFEHKVFLNTLDDVTLVQCGSDTTWGSMFIALHDLIRQAKLNHSVDFVKTVTRLRQDKPVMISTFEQYMFLHHAVQAGVACIGSYTHISAIFLKVHLMGKTVKERSNFETEFKNLCNVEMKMSAGDAIATEDETSKDRFSIFPDKKHNPVLQIDSEGDEDYINAVKVPSLNTQPEQFLTQLPMPTTVNDFWRLVTQYKVSLIVAFKSYGNDKTLATYLPNQVNEPLQCGNLTVNEYSINIAPTWEEMKLIVQGQHSHKVTHLTYTKPDVEPKYLLPFVQRARALRTLGDAVVYTCRNGAELSGFAYVLTTLIDRLDQDDYMAVPVVVGRVKSVRPQVIPTLQQYVALYEAMKLHTEAVISTARYRKEYSSTV